MPTMNLVEAAEGLPTAWRSQVLGKAGGANFKVLRMDGQAYPEECHAFDEALLVVEGCMQLVIAGERVTVHGGEVLIVPAGVAHAVAPGSNGTLVIIDA